MASSRVIWNGNPGEVWVNRSQTIKYQFLCNFANSCGVCIQYHLAIANFWPIPLHRKCCLPGTMIFAPGATGGFEAQYDGPIVRLTFADGTAVSVTPNHMLMTPTGFARAASLVDGDDVIRCPIPDRIKGIAPNHNQGPAFIEDVVRSLAVLRGMTSSRVPVSAEDLHGDGALCHGEINVVSTDRFLRDRIEAPHSQEIGQSILVDAGLSLSSLPGRGNLPPVLLALGDATDGGIGGLREAKAIRWRELRHSTGIGHRLVANRDSVSDEDLADYRPGHAEFSGHGIFTLAAEIFGNSKRRINLRSPMPDALNFRDGSQLDSRFLDPPANDIERDAKAIRNVADRFPGEVTTRKIASVEIKTTHYRGPVFDVESPTTLYQFSNGVVSSNCRCRQILIQPGQSAQPFADFRKLLEDLPWHQQVEAIGASNSKLLESGLAQWDDIVTPTRVRDLQEVVARRKLTVDQMTAVGVRERYATEAFARVHTPQAEAIRAKRRELIGSIQRSGISREQLTQHLEESISQKVGIAAGPSKALPMPARPGAKLPEDLVRGLEHFAPKPALPKPAPPLKGEALIEHSREVLSSLGVTSEVISLEELNRLLPGKMIDRSTPALFDERSGIVYLIRDQEYWSDPAKVMKKFKAAKWLSSDTPEHLAIHEAMHAKHLESLAAEAGSIEQAGEQLRRLHRDEIGDLALREKIRKAVGRYAAIDPSEFVAEVGTALHEGRTFPDWVMDLYRQYHGPRISPARKKGD